MNDDKTGFQFDATRPSAKIVKFPGAKTPEERQHIPARVVPGDIVSLNAPLRSSPGRALVTIGAWTP